MHGPGPTEYAEFYAPYVERVAGGDVLEALGAAPAALEAVLAEVPAEHQEFVYAPGKWSIREVVGHVIDAERLFGFRALHFARCDPAPLPGMDQEVWARASNAGRRELSCLLREFRSLRTANTMFFATLDEATLARSGVASDVAFTVRALAAIMAGHELHHRQVLRERYLSRLPLA